MKDELFTSLTLFLLSFSIIVTFFIKVVFFFNMICIFSPLGGTLLTYSSLLEKLIELAVAIKSKESLVSLSLEFYLIGFC